MSNDKIAKALQEIVACMVEMNNLSDPHPYSNVWENDAKQSSLNKRLGQLQKLVNEKQDIKELIDSMPGRCKR